MGRRGLAVFLVVFLAGFLFWPSWAYLLSMYLGEGSISYWFVQEMGIRLLIGFQVILGAFGIFSVFLIFTILVRKSSDALESLQR